MKQDKYLRDEEFTGTFSNRMKIKYLPPKNYILEVKEYVYSGGVFTAANWFLKNVDGKDWTFLVGTSKKIE